MALTYHELQRSTEADGPEATTSSTRAVRLAPSHEPDERIAPGLRTSAPPSAGNAGPIPIFPGHSALSSHHIRIVLARRALPVPSRRSQ
jgi:hypothetical protein